MTGREPVAADAEDEGSKDAEAWPSGGAPRTDDEGTPEDANETGPHGEAVHQSDS